MVQTSVEEHWWQFETLHVKQTPLISGVIEKWKLQVLHTLGAEHEVQGC